MTLITLSSPHTRQSQGVNRVMLTVLLALVPGFAALVLFFSHAYLIQMAIGLSTALLAEAAMLKLRGRPVVFYLKDLSALVTAALLVLSLPPLVPWWLTVTGTLIAIVLAKQLYGGLGYNPFNPAMVGFAILIVSFPVPMTTLWLSAGGFNQLSLSEVSHIIFAGAPLADAFTGATPLDYYKSQVGLMTQAEIYQDAAFSGIWPAGWIWVSLAYLLGGLWMLWRKIFSWHAPVGMLVALALMAVIFGLDADARTPLHLHILAGGSMLGAFFIVTDPVSGATSRLGKFIFGLGVGALAYIIRTWGSYPDAIAFAVLLMNFAAPFIDHYSKPRTYGHKHRHQGYK